MIQTNDFWLVKKYYCLQTIHLQIMYTLQMYRIRYDIK